MKYPIECPECGGDISEEFGELDNDKEGWYFKCYSCDWKRYLTRKELTILLAVDE